MNTQTTDSPTLSQRLLRQMGRDMFNEGRSLDDCRTTDERIGYEAAMYEAADCQTEMYLANKSSVNWG